MPRDPRGPEYGDASRLERVVTTLLVVGAVTGVTLAALTFVADVGGILGGLGPPWITIPLAVAVVVVLVVMLTGG